MGMRAQYCCTYVIFTNITSIIIIFESAQSISDAEGKEIKN